MSLLALGQQAVGGEPAAESAAPSFRHKVMPLLTRLGCNQGACHGKNAGQNGFRLSLRGYAPEQDHQWMTREHIGRRINRLDPAASLLLRKPLTQVAHEGGKLFDAGSREHGTLLRWIQAGAPGPLPADEEPPLDRLELRLDDRVMKPGQTRAVSAAAHFGDGQAVDVTWLCQFFSNDQSVATVSPDGVIAAVRPGETAIRVHYQDRVQAVVVTIPYEHDVSPKLYEQRRNVVDEHVFNKLAALHIPPSGPCDDATFIRRAYLDTTGALPTPDEVRAFLADESPDKRAALVDALLGRPRFVDYWALQFADLFQNRKERDHDVRGRKDVRSFHAWLRGQVAANRPWDELAREVVTATGDAVDQPQVGYMIVTVGESRLAQQSDVVGSVAQAFMGTRIGCAKCHNHPLERYTQDDYYHFAAFFSRVNLDREDSVKGATAVKVSTEEIERARKRVADAETRLAELRAELGEKAAGGDEQAQKELKNHEGRLERAQREFDAAQAKPVGVTQPRTGQFMAAQPLDREPLAIEADQDPRVALAAWMTEPSNAFFAGAMVNRLWAHYMGVGLVEPVDDLRASNPPSNVPLFNALSREFVQSGYDIRHIMRLILNSRAYQLSSSTLAENQDDRRFYSHYYARRLPAEVMLDAVCDATGIPTEFPGYPVGIRAVQLPDPGVDSYFLSIFGRSERVTACACERSGEVTLPQLLHIRNSDEIVRKLRADEGRLVRLLNEEQDDAKVVASLYLATLSRLPHEDEAAKVREILAGAENRRHAMEDLFWALLNTKEFAFNH